MQNIFGLTVEELTALLRPWKVPAYRARQIAEWMYQRQAESFSVMTNLPAVLREQLAEKLLIQRASMLDRWDSADRRTTKFLLAFADGVAVETVLMRHSYGNSICVSTQAGCAMGCVFCASTVHGVVRNLTAGEMLAQTVFINDFLKSAQERVDTMVLMGSGEPLMNYENVLGFIRLVHEPYCLNLGYRNITLSTSGIVPQMYALAKENLPITLSVSLHAPNDEIRSQLMPVNKKYPIAAVVAAGRDYAEQTKRRVTYEYILIDGVNDSEEAARELSQLLRHQLASVNLIPINPVAERHLKRPSAERVERFAAMLERCHITATVRREMGTDIQAACGQLRNQHLEP